MKQLSTKLFSVILFCFVSNALWAARTYQPSTQNAFTGAGTYCAGSAATALTFTYNTCNTGFGGGTIGAACTITWYTNTTNSTSTATATIVSGPTNFNSATTATGTRTYTPSTTTPGALYYFCVIKRTTAGCGGTAGSTLTSSTTQLITVDALPTAVTVSGGGASCGSATLTATNGSSGTMYFEGTTSNGTSTVTASSSQVITTSGTYYFRAESAAGCWSNQGSATVTINPLPTAVTVTGSGTFCGSTTINASNGGSGTMYYQGTTSNGTSTATPATSEVISTVGTNDYYFRAESAAGCWSAQGSATVTISPIPIVYAVTGGGSYCAGDSGVAVGLANSQTGVNYQLYLGGVATGLPVGGSGSAITFGLQTTGGTYTVEANPTLSCATAMSGSAIISVNPLPAAISGPDSVCLYSSTTVSDATSGGSWSSSFPGIASIASATGVITGNDAGVTTITYSLSGTGCYAVSSFTVNALPTVAAIGGTTNECLGQTATLTETTAGGVWSSASTSIATIDASGIVTGNTVGMTNISYTVTDGLGCINTATTPDTVNAFPIVDAIAGPGNVCVNSSITLTDDSLTGVWASSDNTIATIDASSGVMSGVATGNATITYTITNMYGCATYVTASETVNPLPVVASITGPYTNQCSGTTQQLSDATVGGMWSSSNTSIATVNATGNVTGLTTGSDDISYTVSSAAGCTNSAIYPISIGSPMPASAVVPYDTSLTLCHGNPIDFTVNSLGTGLSYQWYLDASPIPGATNSNYVATVAGQYIVQLNNGTCTLNLPYTDVINPPMPVIGYNTVGPSLFTGSFYSYQWFRNDSAITAISTGAASAVLPVSIAGFYTVVVSDHNGCFDTSASFQYPIPDTSTTATVNVPKNNDITIFPNPGTYMVHVSAPEQVNISILSIDGRAVLQEKAATDVNVSGLAPGMYIMMIYDENNQLLKSQKFTKTE